MVKTTKQINDLSEHDPEFRQPFRHSPLKSAIRGGKSAMSDFMIPVSSPIAG